MPTRAKRPCTRCGVLVSGASRCHTCQQTTQRQQDQRRGSASARGYDSAWNVLRRAVLARDGYRCRSCGTLAIGKGRAHVDHITPKRRGGRDEASNLQTLCVSCHSRKTATQDQGFGHMSRKVSQ